MSDRDARRRQGRQLGRLQKRGVVTSFKVEKDESGVTVNLSLSDRAFSEIVSRVTASVFEIPEGEVDQLNAKINRIIALTASLPKFLGNLFSFETGSGYASALAAASRAINELKQVSQDYLKNRAATKLKKIRFPPDEALGREFQRQYAKRLQLPEDSKPSLDLEAVIRSYHSNIETARETAIKNEPVFSGSLRIAKLLEAIIAEVGKVAEEGSPKAAYLYLTRLLRMRVPENIEPESKVAAFMSNAPLFLRFIRFRDNKFVKLLAFILRFSNKIDYTNDYINVGKLGLEDLLSSLDYEERRTRYGSQTFHYLKAGRDFSDDPFYVAEFAAALKKIGVSPGSAAEMLTAVPIGQRKHTFELLYKKQRFVKLYELLKDAGVDARTFMPFVTELSDVEVQLTSSKVSLYDIINRLALQERQRSGAAWLVRHSEVFGGDDIRQIIELAGSESPVPRLELYRQWRGDHVKGQVVLELAKKLPFADLTALSEALPNVQNKALEALLSSAAALTLEQIVALQQPSLEQAIGARENENLPLPPTAPSKAKKESTVVLWVTLSYQHNPSIIEALMSAYEKTPPHLQHRIRQVYSYVMEHHQAESQESVLMGYVSQLNQMSLRLRKYLLSNDRFFEAFLRHSSGDGFIQRLEQIVKESSNPHSDLSRIPELREQRRMSVQGLLNQLKAPSNGSDSERRVIEAEDGVVYTMAIIGSFGNKTQEAIRRRLSSENIEPTFLDSKKKGRPYDCDAVLIFPGAGTPHNSEVRHYYKSHGYPTRTIVGGYGTEPVARAAISFRDDLVINGRQHLSA